MTIIERVNRWLPDAMADEILASSERKNASRARSIWLGLSQAFMLLPLNIGRGALRAFKAGVLPALALMVAGLISICIAVLSLILWTMIWPIVATIALIVTGLRGHLHDAHEAPAEAQSLKTVLTTPSYDKEEE